MGGYVVWGMERPAKPSLPIDYITALYRSRFLDFVHADDRDNMLKAFIETRTKRHEIENFFFRPAENHNRDTCVWFEIKGSVRQRRTGSKGSEGGGGG